MKSKKRKIEKMPDEDMRPVSFEALAELTNSDVVEQLKIGLSRFAPLESDKGSEEPPY